MTVRMMTGNSKKRRLLLGVNIDHVATLRETRKVGYPDPVKAALLAEEAGADSITLHLREDRRHIQEADVWALKERMIIPMNLELAATEEMIAFACRVKPQNCCIVPERREELTTEGGLDILGQKEKIRDLCSRLGAMGINVSLFVDPDPEQLSAAYRCGAPTVEIHTGEYAAASNSNEKSQALSRIIEAVAHTQALGIRVNAGHGLTYQNVEAIAEISGLHELNIGHAIIAHALFVGIKEAVTEMRARISLASLMS